MDIKAWFENNKKTVKIISMSFLGVLAVLTFALIPINLFCVNFPEWITVVLSVLFCGGLVAYLIVFKTKLVTKIILPVLFAIVAFFCSFFPYIIPYWNSYVFKGYNGEILNYYDVITYKAVEEDFDALKSHLERTHPMFKNGLTEEIENARKASLERLQSKDKITVNDFRREIQTVLHLMGDAHTSTYNTSSGDTYLKVLPQKQSQCYEIVAVNGKTVEQIYDEAKPYYCYETEALINIDLGSLATLDFLGYSEPFIYKWSKGETTVEETYTVNDFVAWDEYMEIHDEYFTPSEPKDFVYYEIDEQKSLAILTLTQCNYNQTYIRCVEDMFTEVKQKNIRNVAVDLCGNGGGSSLVGNEFVKYLPVEKYADGPYDWRWNILNFHSNPLISNQQNKNLLFDGNVFILTDKDSFSAAKDFAMLIQDNHLGKIIGEPSSNAVNGYGEVSYFYLPNTGLYVQISTKKWYRIDSSNTDEYVMPDYPCEEKDILDKLYEII